jgi:hypothetical protein
LAIAFAIVLPAASWLLGAGGLAYRMYSRSGSYRVRATVWDAGGRAHPVSPTALAARAHGAARHHLAGAERWLSFPRSDILAAHAGDLAHLACVAEPAAVRARIDVERRRRLDGPIDVSTAEVGCR